MRVIIGMSVIGEGFSCSDEDLFENGKPIGGNIARYSRFELIRHAFRRFVEGLGETGMHLLDPGLRKQAALFLEKDARKTVYRLDTETPGENFLSFGGFICEVLKRPDGTIPGYGLLHRVFREQHEAVGGQAVMILKNTGAFYSPMGGSFDSSKGEFRKGSVHVGTRSFAIYTKAPGLVQELVDYINLNIDTGQDFIGAGSAV